MAGRSRPKCAKVRVLQRKVGRCSIAGSKKVAGAVERQAADMVHVRPAWQNGLETMGVAGL